MLNSYSMPDLAVEVTDLVKTYDKATFNAVDGISFSIESGKFVAFLGPNGAGKTTTISILTTTLAKSSGKVTVAGFNIDSQPAKVRQHIGIIFQKASLDRNLTAEENIRFHAILYGMYSFRPTFKMMPPAYQKRETDLAGILGIEDVLFNPIKTYSGGMQRKLELVRSLMHEPTILFLDEPTAGLDPLSRRALWDYIKSINKEKGTTVFLTTHYLDEADGADRIIVINKGKIVSEGTTTQIKKNLINQYLLLDSEPRHVLMKELADKGIKYLVTDNGLQVDLDEYEPQELITKIKTKLTILQTHTPSLEDAYLEIIRSNEGNGNA